MESQIGDYITLCFIFVCLMTAGLILINHAITPQSISINQLLENVQVISPKYLMMTN